MRLHRSTALFAVPGLAALVALSTDGGAPAVDRALAAAPSLDGEPVDLVGEGPRAVVRFRVVDAGTSAPIPCRLTFFGPGPSEPELFTVTDAAPDHLAVRKNVVYSLAGEGAITVPPGHYAVVASRGLEWSLRTTELRLADGEEATLEAALAHEIDTRGWVSGDLHLHTLTYSGHGDSNLKERIISLIGEGVEFAVATDHNHNTDYGPTIRELGKEGALTAITGNEVTTPIGHMNAFPLDPDRPVVDASLTDANELFRLIRDETNEFGVTPVIQLNHPRWEGIDYFTRTGLDSVTGASSDLSYSPDFDSLEILNENAGWGYYEPTVDGVPTSSNLHSVLVDWFHLLSRGHRYAAVGNSDSHTVHYSFAGYPRNFIRVPDDDPGAIDPGKVADALRGARVFTTLGPFVQVRANGAAMGGRAAANEGEVTLEIRVQAASWVDCDRVIVHVNGERVAELPVPDARTPLRFADRVNVCLSKGCPTHDPTPLGGEEAVDAWIVVAVEGDDPLPLIPSKTRPIRPLAITNPIWIDGDGDGEWTPPLERARKICERGDTAEIARALTGTPSERALLMESVGPLEKSLRIEVILDALQDEDRRVRLAGLRATEAVPSEVFRHRLDELWEENEDDPYMGIALLRALAACGATNLGERAPKFVERHGADALRRYGHEVLPVLGGEPVRDWLVLGYFDAPEEGTVTTLEVGPELANDPGPPYSVGGDAGTGIDWTELAADPATGYLDLTRLAEEGATSDDVMAYAQTWIFAEEERRVLCALGTDDGARVYLNGALIHDDPARKAASPLQHLAPLDLSPGWNRLLFKVENGAGSFGLYCRVLDGDVRVSARPD